MNDRIKNFLLIVGANSYFVFVRLACNEAKFACDQSFYSSFDFEYPSDDCRS